MKLKLYKTVYIMNTLPDKLSNVTDYNLLGELYNSNDIQNVDLEKLLEIPIFDRPYYDKYINTQNSLESSTISSVEIDEGMFKCFKCGNKKCTYYSIQKRSCDEPPTTYVKCTNRKCNNQWKFG